MRPIPKINPEKINYDYLIMAYCLILILALLPLIIDGPGANDEITKRLMIDSVGKNTFFIENSISQYDSDLLVLHSTTRRGDSLIGIYPPLYPIIMQPVYYLLGFWGIFALNTVCFSLTTFIVFKMAKSLLNSSKKGFYCAVFYSVCIYSLKYSLDFWPHMVSLFLVTLSYHLSFSKRTGLSGIFAGMSIAIRYPNIVFIILLGIYNLLFCKKKGTALFIVFASLPLILTSILNYGLMDDPVKTGYTIGDSLADNTMDSRNFNPIPMFAMLSLAISYLLTSKIIKRKSPIRDSMFSTLVILAFFGVAFDYAADDFVNPAKIMYSGIFDMSAHPSGTTELDKKSLLQASPILILGILSPFIVGWDNLKRDEKMMYATVVSIVLFYSSFFYTHGGAVRFMRYYLDFMPLLSILTFISLDRLKLPKLRPDYLYIPLMLSIMFFFALLISKLNDNLLYVSTLVFPMFIVALLLLSLILVPDKKRGFMNFLVILSIVYGFSVNMVDSAENIIARSYHNNRILDLDSLDDGSAIILSDRLQYSTFGMIKLKKDITLIFPEKDKKNELKGLVDNISSYGRNIYLIPADDENLTETAMSKLGGYHFKKQYGTMMDYYILEPDVT